MYKLIIYTTPADYKSVFNMISYKDTTIQSV